MLSGGELLYNGNADSSMKSSPSTDKSGAAFRSDSSLSSRALNRTSIRTRLTLLAAFAIAAVSNISHQYLRQSLHIYGFSFDFARTTIEFTILWIIAFILSRIVRNDIISRTDIYNLVVKQKGYLFLLTVPAATLNRTARVFLTVANINTANAILPFLVSVWSKVLRIEKSSITRDPMVGLVTVGGVLAAWGKVYPNYWTVYGGIHITVGLLMTSVAMVALERAFSRLKNVPEELAVEEKPSNRPQPPSLQPLSLVLYLAPFFVYASFLGTLFFERKWLMRLPESTMYQKHRDAIVWLLLADALVSSVGRLATFYVLVHSSAITASMISPSVKLLPLLARVLQGGLLSSKATGVMLLGFGIVGYLGETVSG